MGKAGSGKDTIGHFIINSLNDAKRYAFADSLKDQIAHLLNIDCAYLHDQDYKSSHVVLKKNLQTLHINDVVNYPKESYWTIREFMQYYGTDVMQNAFGKNVWINKTFNNIVSDKSDFPVITDVRFKAEYKFVKFNNGIIINIINPYIQSNDTHSSECDLDGMHADYVIINNWKEDPLSVEKQINGIIQQIKNEQ